MGRPFFPKKPWEWALGLFCLLVLYAVFQPSRSYSGPAPRSLAKSLAARYAETHVWPRGQADFSMGPGNRSGRRFAYTLQSVEGSAAIYRIETGARSELWRLQPAEAPRRIGTD